MQFFLYELSWMNPDGLKIEAMMGIVCGESYVEAMEYISRYYGGIREIVDVKLTILGEDVNMPVLELTAEEYTALKR